MDRKIQGLWIGLNADQDLINHIVECGGKPLSAYVSQTNLFSGFKENGLILDSINAAQLPCYPRYRELITQEHSWISGTTQHVNVGNINIKYINEITEKRTLIKAARK